MECRRDGGPPGPHGGEPVTARVVLLEVATGHRDEKFTRGRHWELEWQGTAGAERSGQWYSYGYARELAEACGAAEIEVRPLAGLGTLLTRRDGLAYRSADGSGLW